LPEDAAAAVRAVFHPRDRRFYVAGGYRRLLGHAERVSWALLRYGDPLKKSCYATVALRELLQDS
jgi:tRNA(Glu) U13 pseudouridine synthase TruD